jgi:hypothetical protein
MNRDDPFSSVSRYEQSTARFDARIHIPKSKVSVLVTQKVIGTISAIRVIEVWATQKADALLCRL